MEKPWTTRSSSLSRLEGRVAIVTGGASGIGRAIALRFAEEGARAVILADLRDTPREGGAPTHKLIQERGGEAIFVEVDVRNPGGLQPAIDAAEPFGGVDILVNNAGLLRSGRFVDTTEAEYDAIMDVNVKGVFFASQAAVRSMRAGSRPGVIINLSSMAALQGVPGISAYCAAKGAVRLLTYSLAKELGRHGIRVCALHPGVIDTSMTRLDVVAIDDSESSVDSSVALGRLGAPEDIAGAAVFLASDQAAFITGSSLTVDGGQLCIG